MIPQLLFDIAKCKNFTSLSATPNIDHPCHKIIDFQRKKGALKSHDFQIPEPWSGDIVNAPILIVSSNPAYSSMELYPTLAWPDSIIADFFINRFKNRGHRYSWVYNNKVLNKDGSRGRAVAYWSNIKNRVNELLDREPKPGIDYCITELVHCKSSKEEGVANALPECTRKFLDGIIRNSGAKIIIAVGKFVRDYFGNHQLFNDIQVIYLPHPNAFGPKKLPKLFTEHKIESFRELLMNNNENVDIEYADVSLPSEEEVKEFIEDQTRTDNIDKRK